jgi:hypothetical protein
VGLAVKLSSAWTADDASVFSAERFKKPSDDEIYKQVSQNSSHKLMRGASTVTPKVDFREREGSTVYLASPSVLCSESIETVIILSSL